MPAVVVSIETLAGFWPSGLLGILRSHRAVRIARPRESSRENFAMAYTLPELPYAENAL